MIFKGIMTIFLLLMTFSGTRAQVLWHLKHSDVWISADDVVDSSICFTSLSCSGNKCIAAGIVLVKTNKRITFFHSTDGGNTWNEKATNLELPDILTNDGITKIQAIDSLHIVGVGEPGVVIVSSDGGLTWQRRDCPVAKKIISVHFSDPSTGILTTAGFDSLIFITSDGGMHWRNIDLRWNDFPSCHSYGNGKFRVFKYYWGKIYTTYDNFKTVDSTEPMFDSLIQPRWYAYIPASCTFSNGDTLLSYGDFYPKDTINVGETYGLIIRSTDAGHHWEHPFLYPTNKIAQIDHSTSLDHDTIYAAGHSNYQYLISYNRGASWEADSIVIDTSYLPFACYDLAITSDGHPLSIFSFASLEIQSILTRGEFLRSNVDVTERIIYNTAIYPNPTSGLINIESIDKSGAPIRITDIFGREVTHGKLSDQGKLTLDLSRLPKGVYDVLLNHFGAVFSVGKVVLIGK